MVLATLCLLAMGCQPEKSGTRESPVQSADATVKSPSPTSDESGTTVDSKSQARPTSSPEASSVTAVKFAPGDPKSKMAPRYSPSGKGLKLVAFDTPPELGFDGLQTEVVLGAPVETQAPFKLLVTRAAADAAYTQLYIDADRNGKFDEPAMTAQVSNSRGMIWSSFDAQFKVTYHGEQTVTEDYPVALWLTVGKATDQPEVLRLSRRGHKLGEVTVGDAKAFVVLSDSNNDAVFGAGDWWEFRTEDSLAKAQHAARGRVRVVG